MTLLKSAIALVTGLVIAVGASAAPIDYTFSGIANGSVSGVAFQNQTISIVLKADTSDVSSLFPGAFFATPIEGTVQLGTGPVRSIADGLYVFDIQDPNSGVLGFGTNTLGDLVDLNVGAMESYDLAGPYAASGDVDFSILSQFSMVPLSDLSTLTLTSLGDASFRAAAPVPEPSGLLMSTLGFAALVFRARRRLIKR